MIRLIKIYVLTLIFGVGIASAATDDTPRATQNPPQSLAFPDTSSASEGVAVVVTPPAPATKLEEIQRRVGHLLVRGYTDVAGLRGDDGTAVRVLIVELTDATANQKALGLAIEVRPPTRSERTVLSFVDEDEIDSLMNGLDAMAKIDHGTTSLMNYEARFRTRGMLELANVDNNGSRFITVTATQVLPANAQLIWATATFPLARARELQQQLATAKESLGRLKTESK